MIEDFFYVQKEALKNTGAKLRLLPALFLHLIAYGIIYMFLSRLISMFLGNLFYIEGIIRALVRAAIFSHLLYTLNGIVNHGRIYWKYLSEGFSRYLSPSISAFFAYWIIELLIGLILASTAMYSGPLILLTNLILFLIFSAVAEYIYIGGAYSYDSIMSSLNLLIDEPINWTLVNTVLFIGLGIFGINLDIFRLHFMPDIMSIIGRLVLALYLIYRGNLFKELYLSNRRKREYMR